MNRDKLTKARRSWNMSRIRGKHTTPEKVVRSLLHRLGYRFRLHVRIPITTKHTKPVGRKKAQRAQKSSFSASDGEKVAGGRMRCRVTRFVTPDFVLTKQRIAIFVHGCFWHRHRGCKNCTTPTHRRAWWLKKLNGNAARDKLHQRALRKLGWRPMVIWECETEKPKALSRLSLKLAKWIG